MSIANRINAIISEMGETKNSFAKKIGVTPSTISTAIERNKGVNSDLLEKTINVFTYINTLWLLTGKGKMFLSNDSVVDDSLTEYLKNENKTLTKEVARLEILLEQNGIDYSRIAM